MTDIAPTVAITAAIRQRMIDRLVETGNTHLLPIMETLGLGVALLIMPAGKQRFPDTPKDRNWIALVGDDLLIAEGPSAFHLRSLRKLMERAHSVYVMAGEAVPAAYAAAADLAASGLNVVIVETQTSEERSWSDFVCRHARKAAKTLVTPNAAELRRQRKAAA